MKPYHIMKTPPNWRQGQFVFNFLEWMLQNGHASANQNYRMADPFFIDDVIFYKLYEEFKNDLKMPKGIYTKNPEKEKIRREKIRISMLGNKRMLGHKQSQETIKKRIKIGKEHYNWKGGKTIRKGYLYLRMDKSPNDNSNFYYPEHRIIMEKHLGRKLGEWELVHHKNGNKIDNRIENLSIVLKSTHYGEIKCPYCLKEFLIK